jgi:hypothetical protein
MHVDFPEPIRGRSVVSKKRNVIMFYIVATAYTHWGAAPFKRVDFSAVLQERYGRRLGTTPHMNQTTQAARERYFIPVHDKRIYRLSDHGIAYLHKCTQPTGDDTDGLMPLGEFRAAKNILLRSDAA